MILGLTGTNASGKGTTAAYLEKKGFRYYSLSDELRKLIARRKVPATRENLIEAGRYYRERYGRGYLASVVAKKIKKNENAVIDSIRNLGEVRKLKRLKNFHLIALDAPIRIRFLRARKRGSRRDQDTLSEFIARERQELYGRGPGQQIIACARKADFRINTKDGYAKLYKKIDDILAKLK